MLSEQPGAENGTDRRLEYLGKEWRKNPAVYGSLVAEVEARAQVKADNPDVKVHSRYPIDADTSAQLGMAGDDITEWVALDCKVRP
jgi:hypothetical protein